MNWVVFTSDYTLAVHCTVYRVQCSVPSTGHASTPIKYLMSVSLQDSQIVNFASKHLLLRTQLQWENSSLLKAVDATTATDGRVLHIWQTKNMRPWKLFKDYLNFVLFHRRRCGTPASLVSLGSILAFPGAGSGSPEQRTRGKSQRCHKNLICTQCVKWRNDWDICATASMCQIIQWHCHKFVATFSLPRHAHTRTFPTAKSWDCHLKCSNIWAEHCQGATLCTVAWTMDEWYVSAV